MAGSALVARIGGEEFVVVDIVRAGAEQPMGERLRDALASRVDGVPVTASIGVTGIPVGRVTGGDPAELLGELIARADGAMFSAKRDGGDKVVPTAGA